MKYNNMNVTIDITSRCNLRCKHCRVNEISHDLTMDEIDIIFNKLKPFKPMGVFISGGEPLTRKDIVEIVRKSKVVAPLTTINTNSLLLTEKLLKELIDAGLDYIQVSLDGIEKDHDFIRGKGTYKKTIKKLRLINKYKDKIKLFENLDMLQKKYNDKTIIASDMPIKNVFNEEKAYKVMQKYNLECVGCSAGVNGISIRNDGTVTPCTLLYISCGNILTDDLDDILNGIDMLKIKKRELKGKCGSCKFSKICGGCRAAAYQIMGDFLEEDSECFI